MRLFSLRGRARVLWVVLKEAKPFWIFAVGLLVAGVVGVCWALWFGAPGRRLSEGLNCSGTLLQLFGLALVAQGLSEARTIFGRPTLRQDVRSWVKRFAAVFRRPQSISMEGSIGSSATFGGGAIMTVGPRKDPELPERVAALEKDVALLRTELQKEIAAVRSEISGVKDVTERHVATLRNADQEINRKIEEFAVGGLHLEALGLIWLLLGTVGTSVPDEAAAMLRWLVRG